MLQIFGTKKSKASTKAERFFKERGLKIHWVDVSVKPMSKGEIGRFVQKFGLTALLDQNSKAYDDSGLAYLRVTEESLLTRMLENPALLRLPLVRADSLLAIGDDPTTWKIMADKLKQR